MTANPIRCIVLVFALGFPLAQAADSSKPSAGAAKVVLAEDFESTAVGEIPAGFTKTGAVAVTGNQRHPQLKDVPTLEEAGLKGFDAQQWYGVVGPANMPAAIVKTLNDAMATVLAQPDFKDKLSAEAVELMPMKSAEFAAYMKKDITRWTALAKARDIHLDS